MKSSILISSTESIEGMKIEKYIDLISTNVVLGTNIFSDIGASFSDFFGGTSDIYQNKLEKIYKIGLDKLKRKAQNLSANGIIGIRLDFDEVSGSGKSMFMLSVTGMAVRMKPISNEKNIDIISTVTSISPEELEVHIRKLKITESVKKQYPPSQEEWDFLLENPIEELKNSLLEIYLRFFKNYPTPTNETQKILRNYFILYLLILEEDSVSNILYSRITENPIVVSTLIKESRTFSPSNTLTLIDDEDYQNAILTIDSDKRSYSKNDLELMQSIVSSIENLPETGRKEMVKTLLGSPREKFICENNHQNDPSLEFCTSEGCKKNIRGLTFSEVEKLEEFKLKIKALSQLFD